MSARFFVDTNILLYAHDSSAGRKHETARALVEELWRNRSGVISTQVLQELAVNLQRKSAKPLTDKAVRELVADYLAWDVVINSGDSLLEALDLKERYKISLWDALIVHAAETSGVAVLYSEDLADGQEYGTIRVEDPLR